MKLQFTKTEVEILDHRLTVPDAVADALAEDGFTADDVMDCCDRLAHQFNRGEPWNVTYASSLEKAIIKDCCDGSTFFGCGGAESAVATGELSRGRLLNWQKASLSLTAKLKSVGIEVNIPNY